MYGRFCQHCLESGAHFIDKGFGRIGYPGHFLLKAFYDSRIVKTRFHEIKKPCVCQNRKAGK